MTAVAWRRGDKTADIHKKRRFSFRLNNTTRNGQRGWSVGRSRRKNAKGKKRKIEKKKIRIDETNGFNHTYSSNPSLMWLSHPQNRLAREKVGKNGVDDEHIWLTLTRPLSLFFFFNLVSYTVCTYSIYLWRFVRTHRATDIHGGRDFQVETITG
ncbi:hypothetical protein F5888DRAFT_444713 [Russula emetica]|nr:hypothetical protein F5888DRAFT_444713 [Russula emetica]